LNEIDRLQSLKLFFVPLLLSEILPALARELERLLIQANENALSAQVHTLTIVDRCRCGDDFVQRFILSLDRKDVTSAITAT
jgi:hypothetical protein